MRYELIGNFTKKTISHYIKRHAVELKLAGYVRHSSTHLVQGRAGIDI